LATKDPDADMGEMRSQQTRRGMAENLPGYKKKIRMELKPIVLKRRKQGASIGQIAQELGLNVMTVCRWIRQK